MTTIATDGKTMAGDGKTTCGGAISSTGIRKVFKLRDGSLFGGCGNMGDVRAVMGWLDANQADPRPSCEEEFGALLVRPNGVFVIDHNLDFNPVEIPFAVGTGNLFAIGAMDAGATPAEAVAIASKRDTHTGGNVIVETFA